MFFAMFVIVIVFIIAIIAIMTVQQIWKYRKVKKIPGPTALPLLGNALEFGLTPVAFLSDLNRLCKKWGSAVRLKMGPLNTYIIVTDPDLAKYFLSSPKILMKSKDYEHFRPWIANGLLISTGSYWQRRRKIITPTFHFNIIEEFLPVFNSGINILIKKLSEEVDKDVCDVYPFITAFALDSICETAMGVSVNAQYDPDNEYFLAAKTVLNIAIERIFSPWKRFDALFVFTNDFQVQKKSLQVIHGFTKSVIKKRHQELWEDSKTLTSTKVEDDIGAKKKQAFLDLLLQSTIDGKPLTDADICEEVDTFMIAGHDTVAAAICFAMYELSRNQEVQQKAYEELNKVFHKKKDSELTMTDLQNLNYMELVIKETMRLYPSIPLFGREICEEVEHNGTVYPKGLTIAFFPYCMHRRADLYPDPETFKPERFSSENSLGRHPFSYIPFSAGPRNCIGQKFAMFEMKSVLAKILLNFKLLPVDTKYDVILSAEAVLKSENGIRMQLKKR